MKYSLSQLETLPTLHQGHSDDLKINTLTRRVWLSRLTVEDGMPYNNQVTVEVLTNEGSWMALETYEAR